MRSHWSTPDPNFAARVTESFNQQQVMHLLGADLSVLKPGLCTISVPFRAELGQQNGFFHAGITSTIADSAGGYAGYTLMPANSNVLTVEFKVSLLRPASGSNLSATGKVIRAGRNLVFTEVEVFVGNGDDAPKLCATMTQTLATIHNIE